MHQSDQVSILGCRGQKALSVCVRFPSLQQQQGSQSQADQAGGFAARESGCRYTHLVKSRCHLVMF